MGFRPLGRQAKISFASKAGSLQVGFGTRLRVVSFLLSLSVRGSPLQVADPGSATLATSSERALTTRTHFFPTFFLFFLLQRDQVSVLYATAQHTTKKNETQSLELARFCYTRESVCSPSLYTLYFKAQQHPLVIV